MDPRPTPPVRSDVPRLLAALAGLVALWVGCSLANAPLHLGGPMNLSLNAVLGLPLVALGTVGIALAPPRAWAVAWLLAAALALATAGANLWAYLPIGDGAFQSLRLGAPDPDRWPAAAFLHALALAPVGVAPAALLPPPGRVVPLLLASAAAAFASGIALEAFAGALLRGGLAAGIVTLAVPAAGLLALALARGGGPAARAVAGQAVVLLALCLLLRVEWARMT